MPNRLHHRSERVCGTSKTPEISIWVKSAPKICPREARTKCIHQNTAVARHDTRSPSLTRKQALSRTQSGCLVHTDPGHGSRTAEAHSMRISEAQSCPNSRKICAHQARRATTQIEGPHMTAATAPGTMCVRSARFRPARAVRGSSCATRRADHHRMSAAS
jgi:hypothetical protein